MYEARDAAFKEYLGLLPTDEIACTDAIEVAEHAFNAGWKARKEVDFRDWEIAGATIKRFIPADAGVKEHIVIEMPENA